MGPLPDISALFWLAMVGLAAMAIGALVGVPALVWWLFHHVQFI